MSRRRTVSNNTPLIVIIIVTAIAFLGYIIVSKGTFNFDGDSSICIYGKDDSRDGYCMTSNANYDELVIISGNTQNTPIPSLDFTKGELSDMLSDVFYNSKNSSPKITILSVAGNNYKIGFESKYKPARNINASNNNLKKLSKAINLDIQKPATDSGADYLGGIIEASHIISTESKNPAIIVVGSGLNDKGILNFSQDDIIDKYINNPKEIDSIIFNIRGVKEKTLEKATVRWYGLGSVVSPQQNMNKYRQDIQDIYEKVFNQIGIRNVDFSTSGIGEDTKSVDTSFTVGQVYVRELEKGEYINLNENVGKFEPDSDVFLDNQQEEKVKEALKKFIKRFNSNKSRLKATGYISACYDPGTWTWATPRANKIKKILIELGVSEDRIEIDGEPNPPDTNKEKGCNSKLSPEEQRTVKVEVV